MPAAGAITDAEMPSVGSDKLAEGLMLVRASTLKIIRLQLAMERRDQRVALEAVDDLVALDRCLQEFLTHYPNSHETGLLGNVLDLEQSALSAEKHTLAAGFSKAGWQAQTAPRTAQADALSPMVEESLEFEAEPYEFRLPPWLKRTILLSLTGAVTCAAYVAGASGSLQALL